MPKTKRPQRVYDFTAFARRTPAAQLPADRLDAQFSEHANRIVELQLQLEKIDTSLNIAAVDADERPRFLAEIRAAADEARAAAHQALMAVHGAELKARAVDQAAARIELRAREAQALLEDLGRKVDRALGAADALEELARAPVPPNEPLEGPKALGYNAGGWHAVDVMGATATSADYAEVAINWAEYMPWTIPPNILAINAITGDHWSSRWWAHRAGEYVGGFLNGYYMGPFPTPPQFSLTGGPILLGALYFNTTDNVMYVWNGTAWIPFHTPQAAATGSFFYVATAGQTVFDLTQADIYGNLLSQPLTPEEGIDVHLNGVRLAPWTAAFDGDYVVDLPTSSIILQQGAQDAALLTVDVLLDKSKLAPAFVAIEKLEPFAVDGTTTTFPLIDSTGAQLTLLDASQLAITLDGVTQEPGRDYQLDVSGQNVVFLFAPGADSNVFTIWFSNSLIGAGGSIVVVHDLTLRGSGTIPDPLGVVDATPTQLGGVRVPGGSCLSVTTGSLGVVVANAAQIVNGTNNSNPVTPVRLRDVTGDDVNNLNTTAKQIVPAINEIVGILAGAQQLIGNMDASTGLCVFDPVWGIPNGLLPPAAAGNDGKYVIVSVAGTPPAGPPETQIPVVVGDWFISTGATWLHLAVGGMAAIASSVSLNPNVFGRDNVQDALEEAEAIVADAPFLPLFAGLANALTGPLFGGNMTFQSAEVGNALVTGVLTVLGPNSLLMTGAAGTPRALVGGTIGVARWQMSLGNAEAEGGANTGSNFELNATSDAGGIITRALHVERSTGKLSLNGDPTQPLHAATKAYVDSIRGLVFTDLLPPPNPVPGMLWWRPDPDGELYVYYDDGDSLQWVPASPTNSGAGPGGGAEVDPLSLHLTGGTMTGQLMLAADPVLDMEAATKLYVDAVVGGGTVDATTYFVNRTPQGSTSGDLNTILLHGAYNIAGTNFGASANRPPLGTNGGNANTNTLILHVFRSGGYAIQEAYEGPDDITGNNSYPIYTKWMRSKGNNAAAWSAWVQQSLSLAGGGAFLPLTGGTLTGPLMISVAQVAENQTPQALQVLGNLHLLSQTGGAFRYVNRGNNQGGLTYVSSGVPVYTDWLIFNANNNALSINNPNGNGINLLNGSVTVTGDMSATAGSFAGFVTAGLAPTQPTHLVNKAYADALTGVASGAWTNVTISGGFSSTDLQARTIPGGRFEMRGSVARITSWTAPDAFTATATLPVGMRPPSPDRRFFVPLFWGGLYYPAMAQIQPSGVIAVQWHGLPGAVPDANSGRWYFDNVSLGST